MKFAKDFALYHILACFKYLLEVNRINDLICFAQFIIIDLVQIFLGLIVKFLPLVK